MNYYKQNVFNRGFTIVELMIALAISMVLVLGATSFMATTDRANRLQSAVSGLNVSGRFGLDRLARDIRMSGYRDSNWSFGALANVINAIDGLPAAGGDSITLLYEGTRDCAFVLAPAGVVTNTYQVVNPLTFLCTEAVNSKRFARLVPPKRLMDNMELSFQTPQEDEFAPCLMTLRSLYVGISFARREDHYLRYLNFDGVDRDEIETWKAAFLWFLKKLTYKYRRGLLLKSPPHTARIRLLLEMFPEA